MTMTPPTSTRRHPRPPPTASPGAVVRTPTLAAARCREMTGAEVWLKFENLQFTAAYKERGALNKLLQLDRSERARGVIAASAGNHAQGVAYHGSRLGIPVTIVMPEPTPTIKVTQTEGHGADGHPARRACSTTPMPMRASSRRERGLIFVHPFDDPRVIAGQGTVALEMLADAPDLDTLVVPIGGGGLISGIAIAAKALKPDIEVDRRPGRALSVDVRRSTAARPAAARGDTLAEGIAVKEPGEITAGDHRRELVDDIVLVAERDIETRGRLLRRDRKDGGRRRRRRRARRPARLSRALPGPQCRPRPVRRQYRHASARQRAAARSRPLRAASRGSGSGCRTGPARSFNVARMFDQQQVNIIEIYHQRVFTTPAGQGPVIDIECEARDAAHLERLIGATRSKRDGVQQVERGSARTDRYA